MVEEEYLVNEEQPLKFNKGIESGNRRERRLVLDRGDAVGKTDHACYC